jgi:hypothetical protein
VLLKVKSDILPLAEVTQFDSPLSLHRSETGAGLAARDEPVNSGQVDVHQGLQQRLG